MLEAVSVLLARLFFIFLFRFLYLSSNTVMCAAAREEKGHRYAS